MEMILTRSTKKLMLTAALVLGVLYLLYRSGGGAAARDCPKTESMSKKTSMISQDGTLYEYDRQSPLIFIGGVPRWVLFLFSQAREVRSVLGNIFEYLFITVETQQ